MQILMDLQVLISPEHENKIFSYWSVCICVSVCVYYQIYQHYSKTNYSRNFKFHILHLYSTYLKLFMKIRQTICAQSHTKEFYYIMVCRGNFLIFHFHTFRLLWNRCNLEKTFLIFTKCNEIQKHFCHSQKNI